MQRYERQMARSSNILSYFTTSELKYQTFHKRLCSEEPVKRNQRINKLSMPLYTGCKQIIFIYNSLHDIERNFTVCTIEPVEIYLCLLSTKLFSFGSKAASVYDRCCNTVYWTVKFFFSRTVTKLSGNSQTKSFSIVN